MSALDIFEYPSAVVLDRAPMTFRFCRTMDDCLAWDRFVYDHTGAHYFQTYGWLKSYEPMGFQAHVLVGEVEGTICGGVGFLSAKLPLVPWRIAIVPHGPLPSDPDAPTWMPIIDQFDVFCRDSGVVYAQLYPHELSDVSVLAQRLDELGFTAHEIFTGHRFSSTPVTIDLLGKSEAQVLMSFRPKTRQYVRKAMDSGCTVRTDVTPAVFDTIYALLSEHGDLMGYRPRPYSSLKAAWEWFAPREWATFIQVWRDGVLIGAILVVFTGRTAYYLAGAVRRGYNSYRPGELLHWYAIREAMRRQMTAYDLVNLGSEGVAQFKAGFRPTYRSWHEPRTKRYRPLLASLMKCADRSCRPLLRTLARYRANLRTSADPPTACIESRAEEEQSAPVRE